MKKKTLLLFSISFLFLQNSIAQIQFQLQEFKSGFNRPLDIKHANDSRLFIVEQNGKVRIIDADGNILPTPFLDLNLGAFGGANEQGFLGFAFHPDYANNGFCYVNYTDASGNTKVERFKVSANDPNIVDPDSRTLVITIMQPFQNHNGGCLQFGPDGYLYIGMGDGGSANDPQGNGQNHQTLLGKMLRIDVDVDTGYAIPNNNPFANDDFAMDEIWALGLRNPWRFSFDRLTGDLWIGDVGQEAFEEIDFQAADSKGGENYGWKCFEGNSLFDNREPCSGNPSDYTAPIFEYHHNEDPGGDGCSITGGYVYRGTQFPELYGHYIYTDFCSGIFWSLSRNCDGELVHQKLAALSPFSYSGFGEDVNGELYVCSLNEGKIYQITATACSHFSLCSTQIDESCLGANDGSINVTPMGGLAPFTYNWSVDSINLSAGDYSVTVTDTRGCTTTKEFTIQTKDTLVQPVISYDSLKIFIEDSGHTYQWYWDGNPIEGAVDTFYLHEGFREGIYKIEVIYSENCRVFSEEYHVLFGDVKSSLGIEKIEIQSNPTQDAFILLMEMKEAKPIHIQIFDITGRLQFQQNLNPANKINERINLSSFYNGVYFLQIEIEGQSFVEKIVKQ